MNDQQSQDTFRNDDLKNAVEKKTRSTAKSILRWGILVSVASVIAIVTCYSIEPLTKKRNASFQASPPSFEMTSLLIPREEIHSGGPAKDEIPAIWKPTFLKAAEANYLKPTDRIIGVQIGKTARAYPIAILNYHEIVNDKIGEIPIAVTYCPLCDSAVVFDRRTKAGEREFGVSGLLYNSNVLMYDRNKKSERLWSQMMTKRVSGEEVGEKLNVLPLELTTWKDWQARHPETEVLSNETGHNRNYFRSPYDSYFTTPELMFPVNQTDERLPVKTPVLGVWTNKSSIAFPLSSFSAENKQRKETIDGIPFTLIYDDESKSVRIAEAGKGIQSAYSLWFAWYAFHPETKIYSF